MAAGPMLFAIEKAGSEDSKVTHCGVIEFTAEDGCVYLPSWVMQKLGVSSGSSVSVRSVDLALGIFARLQPESDVLQDEHDPVIALQHALGSYMALSVGDCIPVAMPGGRIASFRVVELQPAPAVCIVNTDLRLELDAPVAPVRDAAVLRVDGEALSGTLQPGEYAYYRFVAPKPTSVFQRKDYILRCLATSGDPDVYVSCDDSNKFPTMDNYEWRATDNAARSRLRLLASDDRFVEGGAVYVAVHALLQPAQYTLAVVAVDSDLPDHMIQLPGSGQVLGGSGVQGAGTARLAGVQYEKCPLCGQDIPAMSLVRHQLHCARSNYRCEQCQVVIPVEAKEKHEKHEHDLIQCECGTGLRRSEVPMHKMVCERRRISCRFCNVKLPHGELTAHLEACGGRTDRCQLCQQFVVRRMRDTHLAVEHRINPSLPDAYENAFPMHSGPSPAPSSAPSSAPLAGPPPPPSSGSGRASAGYERFSSPFEYDNPPSPPPRRDTSTPTRAPALPLFGQSQSQQSQGQAGARPAGAFGTGAVLSEDTLVQIHMLTDCIAMQE